MTEWRNDFDIGCFATALQAAVMPIQSASSAANILVGSAGRVELVPADRQAINALAAELEVSAAALRSAAKWRGTKPVLLEAAE
jgi:hypothetical protein